jgi:DNA-binding NtrC family response regulator
MMALGKTKPKVAIVDDDPAVRSRISATLRADFEVLEGQNYEDAYRLLEESELDVLALDMIMPPAGVRECTELLQRLSESEFDTSVIVLSDDSKKATALKVIDAGAYDYFIKPIDLDVLHTVVVRAMEELQLQRENLLLRHELQRKDALGDLLGSTDAMRHVFDTIRRVARSATTVMIRGESGTGKELVARAIHDQSPRRNRPFIGVNCAALPESLMESELFGYEKGAFTGAVATKEGRVELASRGTLFLDEIGTLPPSLQSKLLRVLEEHTLVRLGGKKPIRVDFRLLTATNEDLEELVRDNRFREDLYYRINVVPIFLPPLRDRVEDIPLLVDYFLQVYCAANRVPTKRISDEAFQALKRYTWPGNVRELENAVQRMVLMTDGEIISITDLPGDILQTAARGKRDSFRLPATGFSLEKELQSHERRWVEAALAQSNRVKSEAARLLGVDRNRMNYLCRKYDL